MSRRGLAQTHGCKNVVQLLRQVLNLSAGEAAVKVRLAAAVSPRHMLTGQVVAPLHPDTAAAFTAGEVSARSADIVTRTVDRLPDCVLEEAHSAVEAVLLDFARPMTRTPWPGTPPASPPRWIRTGRCVTTSGPRGSAAWICTASPTAPDCSPPG